MTTSAFPVAGGGVRLAAKTPSLPEEVPEEVPEEGYGWPLKLSPHRAGEGAGDRTRPDEGRRRSQRAEWRGAAGRRGIVRECARATAAGHSGTAVWPDPDGRPPLGEDQGVAVVTPSEVCQRGPSTGRRPESRRPSNRLSGHPGPSRGQPRDMQFSGSGACVSTDEMEPQALGPELDSR